LDHYEALAVLLNGMNTEVRANVNAGRKAIREGTKAKIEPILQAIRRKVGELREGFGARLPGKTYVSIIRELDTRGSMLQVPILVLESWFTAYRKVAPTAFETNRYPLHARIEMDTEGRFPKRNTIEVYIPEAVLFEDMCCFYNRACDLRTQLGDASPYERKKVVKEVLACQRAAVSSAFYMVEAYCNGLAFELAFKHRHELSPKELMMVMEWDETTGRAKYLKTRAKLLTYPRLLARSASPLVQENNCPELKYLLEDAKRFRDAIVHNSPFPEIPSLELVKSKAFTQLDAEDCTRVVDSAIVVLERISSALGRSLFWLQHRRDDGRFDDSVFS
jgi:hypothetical protein